MKKKNNPWINEIWGKTTNNIWRKKGSLNLLVFSPLRLTLASPCSSIKCLIWRENWGNLSLIPRGLGWDYLLSMPARWLVVLRLAEEAAEGKVEKGWGGSREEGGEEGIEEPSLTFIWALKFLDSEVRV